jgi:hypothetical protein
MELSQKSFAGNRKIFLFRDPKKNWKAKLERYFFLTQPLLCS